MPPRPLYHDLLRRHHPNQPVDFLNSISIHDLGIGADVILERHTLYFETLTTTLYISASDLKYDGTDADDFQGSRISQLHDNKRQLVGIAEIMAPVTGSLTEAWTAVHVAILSGTCDKLIPESLATDEMKQHFKTHHTSLVQVTPRKYQVLLLREQTPRGGQLGPGWRVYERIGLGDVLAARLERMEDLNFEWVWLQ